MNKLSLLERSDGDFNVANIYPTPETDNDSGINHINGDEIDICVDDEVFFFVGAWVVVIYEQGLK